MEQEQKLHANFSICLQCQPCGTGCSYFSNTITFIPDKYKKKIRNLTFDQSQAVCNGECAKECITKFSFAKTLKGIK